MTDGLLGQIAGTGVVGAMLAVALLVIRSLHIKLEAEKNARIEDGQKYNALALGIQKEVIVVVHKLGDMIDFQKESQREMLEKLGDILDYFKRRGDDDHIERRR